MPAMEGGRERSCAPAPAFPAGCRCRGERPVSRWSRQGRAAGPVCCQPWAAASPGRVPRAV